MSHSSTSLSAQVTLHPEFKVGEVEPRVFGSFIEHLGRVVYGGIFEPGHPKADEQGFRRDVIELVRELQVPIVRYPGGNFVSGYNWEDGIGPVEKRPHRLSLAWSAIETNRIGTDEFVDWARKANAEVMMAINLGSRDFDAARNFVEYCNFPGGTYWSDLRIANGHKEPHRIKTWCLGNEMDGGWQIGHKNAADYAKAAQASAHVMKLVDPTIELIACGSSFSTMPTFPAWEADVLDVLYDQVDYVSLHSYLSPSTQEKNTPRVHAARAQQMEHYISEVIASCDYVKARKRSRKMLGLCFDEWNVWYHNFGPDQKKPEWKTAPTYLEDIYTFEDMILFCGMMLALLRHADRIKIACLAQLVNAIAPIMTVDGGPAWRQSIFYPFLHGSLYGRGTVLRAPVVSPVFETKEWGEVTFLDFVAVLHPDKEELTLFAVNKSEDQPLHLKVALAKFSAVKVIEHLVMESDDPKAVNDAANPDRIVPRAGKGTTLSKDVMESVLPPFSWNVIRLKVDLDGK